MAQDPKLHTVKYHAEFATDGIGRMRIAIVLGVINLVLMVMIGWYSLSDTPQPKYFAAVESQYPAPFDQAQLINSYNIVKEVPLTEPILVRPKLFIWANHVVTTIYSFNFTNADVHFPKLKHLFTETGWQSFEQAVEASGIVDAVKSKRLIVSAVAKQPPVLIQMGIENGVFTHDVHIVIYVEYVNSATKIKQEMDIDLKVVRVKRSNAAPWGIAIEQFKVSKVNRVL